jgi:phosphoenolpyruvate---glycerone phosphotransferase subunit DhaL
MTMTAGRIDSAAISAALSRIARGCEAAKDELCAADGELGDGDLGITVAQGFGEIAKEALPADLGMAFLACAKTFQRVSSSSLGTLIATAFMAAAKDTKGKTEIGSDEVPRLLALARDAMMARGKGNLGDKTVLDSVDAVARALDGKTAGEACAAAVGAAARTIEDFRGKPCKLGRARMFAEKSAAAADPGQLAFLRIVEALARA